MYKGCGIAPTIISKRGTFDSTVHGRIYVFRAYSDQTNALGEMYVPSTKKLTHISSSQTLIDALHIGFDHVLSSTILGNKIIIRSLKKVIVLDVEYSAWSPFPLNLLNY